MKKGKNNFETLYKELEEEAWKEISRCEALVESQLDKFRDKLDWEELSANQEIRWTASMLERFADLVNWSRISVTLDATSLSPEIIEKFLDRWDWENLSWNSDLPLAVIEKYPDRLDWSTIINRYGSCINSICLLERFAEYIPADSLKDSRLWNELVSEKEDELKKRLCSES